MRRLYVLYDSRCELCCRLAQWLCEQEAWLEVEVLPASAPRVRQMFPVLETITSGDDLVVVSDEGEVYLGDRAWIMCLFALVKYRKLSRRLAHPLLLPLARQAYEALSRNRYVISRWLRRRSAEEVASELGRIGLPPCAYPTKETISDYLR
jgi:predicted DCC family thiol-disulfide oxidoreductase YuxK